MGGKERGHEINVSDMVNSRRVETSDGAKRARARWKPYVTAFIAQNERLTDRGGRPLRTIACGDAGAAPTGTALAWELHPSSSLQGSAWRCVDRRFSLAKFTWPDPRRGRCSTLLCPPFESHGGRDAAMLQSHSSAPELEGLCWLGDASTLRSNIGPPHLSSRTSACGPATPCGLRISEPASDVVRGSHPDAVPAAVLTLLARPRHAAKRTVSWRAAAVLLAS